MSLTNKESDITLPIALDQNSKEVIYYSPEKGDLQQIISKVELPKLLSYDPRDQYNQGFAPLVYGDSLVYVAAARGAGKSMFANKYINNYSKQTSNKIFLITRLKEDPSIQLPDRSMKILTKDLIQAKIDGKPLEVSDLEDSLVVFDDIIDATQSKKEKDYLQNFILDTLENSRHYHINVLITSHMISDYKKTRAVINECSALVVFPQYSNTHQIEYALKNSFGLNNQTINRIMEEDKSRWVMVQTRQPKFIMTQYEIFTYK